MAKQDDAATFDYELVVLHQFGFTERGTRINDAAEIQKVIDEGHADKCVKVAKEAK
jgi:hypothetical protein